MIITTHKIKTMSAPIILKAKETISDETAIYLCIVINKIIGNTEYWSPQYIEASDKYQIDMGNNWWLRIDDDKFTITARHSSNELMAALKTILLFREKEF
jgi:hypothetical protein